MLEARLIGKFDIQYDGKPVIISSRTAQSLFAYLILTSGTLHRREKLAGIFWPDESEQKARAYLRNELWRIRKALAHTSKVEYLLADNLTFGFNQSSAYWLDVEGLKNLSNTASTEELIQSLSDYQGELLPGFYEDWVVLEREHLHVLFEQKITCLLEVLEKEQRWQDLLEWAERWISLGQSLEAPYRALMVAYDVLGDHSKVTSTYERCKQALLQLDLEPSEQTRVLVFKRNPKIKIPIPLTSFIGREKELKEVTGLFSKSRLITLTGSGGMGKTRLAIQVTAEVLDLFPDGIWLLDLAPLTDPSVVPNTLASLLGVRESGEIVVTELLINFFRSRTALIIFDNCEHLIDASAQLINSLMIYCENLSILATSRETLRVSGELPYRVPSLQIPKPNTEFNFLEISSMEAVKLFVARAAVASPRFVLSQQNAIPVAQICQQLDGIPLALELAAARTNVLTVEEILQHLNDRFNLLTYGLRSVLPRHQTLRATIEWSHELLSQKERILFRRLAVFMGGWTLDAAKEVCSQNGIEFEEILDLLAQLANKSLVLVETSNNSETRYRSLETIRQFALEMLRESYDERSVQVFHLDFFVKFAEDLGSKLRGAEQLECLNRLDKEYDNLRVALEQSKTSGNIDAGLRIAWSLMLFWSARGYWSEAKSFLINILALPDEVYKTSLRVKGLIVAGLAATLLNDIALAQSWLDEGIEIARDLGPASKSLLALSLGLKGYSIMSFNLSMGQSLCEQALAIGREIDDKYVIANVLDYLGNIYTTQGDYTAARAASDESVAVFLETNNRWMSSRPLGNLGLICYQQRDYEAARSYLQAGLEIYREIGDKANIAFMLETLGDIDRIQGNYLHAGVLYEESLVIRRRMGDEFSIAILLANLGNISLQQGNLLQAITRFEESLGTAKKTTKRAQIWICLTGFVGLAIVKRQPEFAARLLGVLDNTLKSIGTKLAPVHQIDHTRNLAAVRAQLDEATFTAAWATGRQMHLDEAVAVALKEMR
jgi:predicted ATPase/DNA-binding SARP family transcriptional activator/tetratricopeptide (TPR) repeat protein